MFIWVGHGDWPPVREAQGASSYFGYGQPFLPNYMSDSNQIRYKASDLVILRSLSESVPSEGAEVQLTPKSSIVFKCLSTRGPCKICKK